MPLAPIPAITSARRVGRHPGQATWPGRLPPSRRQPGDIAGVIWTTDPEETGIDIYFGIGGAPEGVLAAAALRCIGGQMQGRLHPLKKEEELRAAAMGITDIRRKFNMNDMASDDVIFSATGVTDGSLLDGVHVRQEFAETETVVLRSKTGTVRRIKTTFRMLGTKAMPTG